MEQIVDNLYKCHYGKLLSWVLKVFPDIRLETAEDLVQDAFTSALYSWTGKGMPSNPVGWIFTVCRNGAINAIRKEKIRRAYAEPQPTCPPESMVQASAFSDESLQLLFACAHPDLSPKGQVAITLKYVANLRVGAIAAALGMTVDGIDKLLIRARKQIRDDIIQLAEPGLSVLADRLPIVHKIIYLIFNEGYKTSAGKEILREELCEEALLINKALLDHKVGDGATAALHALMLFNAARFKARFGPGGDLLDLEGQDRCLWNRPLISLGCQFLKSSRGCVVSTYHYEASIAFVHCVAPDFKATDWPLISRLYRQLLDLSPNPFVELNYAIALYYAGQPAKAFDLLLGLNRHPFLHQYYPLNAALGKLYLLEGDHAGARAYLLKAFEQAMLPLEKDFVRKMMALLK